MKQYYRQILRYRGTLTKTSQLIFRKFDLKGSTVDREASDKELEKELPTLKDNDFIKQGVRIDIGDAAKEKLLETLTADVEVSFGRLEIFQIHHRLIHSPERYVCYAEAGTYAGPTLGKYFCVYTNITKGKDLYFLIVECF